MKHRFATILVACLAAAQAFAASPGYAPMENPVGPGSWWWDEAWWERGEMPVPANHALETRWIEYDSGDVSVTGQGSELDDDAQVVDFTITGTIESC